MESLYNRVKPFLANNLEECREPLSLKYRQICMAKSAAYGKDVIVGQEAVAIGRRIEVALGTWIDLEDWVWAQPELADTLKGLDLTQRQQQFQAYRHRWLKHLCDQHQLQEIFSKVVLHLRKQGAPSLSISRQCVYRGTNNRQCAVGCLIPDEYYSTSLEGMSVDRNPVIQALTAANVIPTNKDSLRRDIKSMLKKLQGTHDTCPVHKWESQFLRIAQDYSLEVPK